MDANSRETFTRTSRLHIDEHEIVWVVIQAGAEQLLTDAQDNVAAAAHLLAGRTGLILVDMRGVKSMDRNAREYYSGPEAARTSRAIAIIVSSPISRMVGNFVITTFRGKLNTIPVKLVATEPEAVTWLLSVDSAHAAR